MLPSRKYLEGQPSLSLTCVSDKTPLFQADVLAPQGRGTLQIQLTGTKQSVVPFPGALGAVLDFARLDPSQGHPTTGYAGVLLQTRALSQVLMTMGGGAAMEKAGGGGL